MGDTSEAVGITDIVDKPGDRYELRIDGAAVGHLTYRALRTGRRTLLHTEVDEAFRGRGFATALIRGALDDLQRQQATITVFCPAVHAVIQRYPEYATLVDAEHPGAWPKDDTEREDPARG